MNNINNMSLRYKKALVTVLMGFRNEEDILNNGLSIYTKKSKKELINKINDLYFYNNIVLALLIKNDSFKSVHYLIDSIQKMDNFILSIDSYFKQYSEIWTISGSGIDCYRCRMYIGYNNIFEMAYSTDDHILDHIDDNALVKYARYEINNSIKLIESNNLHSNDIKECENIISDILSKYKIQIDNLKEDLNILSIDAISLDIRVNNGYDFHDFDALTEDVIKIIN